METKDGPTPLPSAPAKQISSHVTIQPPLSHRGHGPGLLMLLPEYDDAFLNKSRKTLDPPPLQKWAEEGYTVVEIRVPATAVSGGGEEGSIRSSLRDGVNALLQLEECDTKDKIGLMVYDSSLMTTDTVAAIQDIKQLVAIVTYGYSSNIPTKGKWPYLVQLPGQDTELPQDVTASANVTIHKYPEAKSPFFVIPKHPDFITSSAGIAHSRTLTFLKGIMGGPYFDLVAAWEEHTYLELGERSAAKTMSTMVQEPYVSLVSTIAGGVGRENLQNFYHNHFIPSNPEDAGLELISRTIGIDRVVDECIFKCTHTKQMDWLAPCIPATGRTLRVPMNVVVNIRGDRLYHEHIWFDEASVLVQLGVMPEYLPFPYPLADGRKPAPGKRFEYRVPAAGLEVADNLIDNQAVESNQMMKYGFREVDDV